MTSTFVIDQSEKLLSWGALLYVGGVGGRGRGSEEITGGLEINSRVLCIYMGNSSVSGHSSVHGDFWERRCEELLVHQGAMTQDKSPAQLSSLCAHLAKRPVLIHSATHSCETAILFARWMTFFVSFDSNNLRSRWTKVVVFEVPVSGGWTDRAGHVTTRRGPTHTLSAEATSHQTHTG